MSSRCNRSTRDSHLRSSSGLTVSFAGRLGRLLGVVFLLSTLPMLGGCEMWAEVTGDTAGKAARRMQDKEFPDERREGINSLVWRDFAQKPPYTLRYKQIADDPAEDSLVRATAVRALNQSRDKSATALFIRLLADPNDMVRLEAVKALNRVPDDQAVDPLLRLSANPDQPRDIRISAVEALRNYKSREVAQKLVQLLDDREFAVTWQARQSLIQVTGKDLGYDTGAWLKLLTS